MNSDIQYPKTFRSMEDVKSAIENFPREIWEEDMKDILSRRQGYMILGVDPLILKDENCQMKIDFDPIFLDEIIMVLKNDDKWEEIIHIDKVTDKDLITFKFNKKKYIAQWGDLPYMTIPGIDSDYILDKLYGLESVKKQMNEYKKLIDTLPEENEDLNKETSKE